MALDDKWCPAVVVFAARLPKGPTGKPLRIKLADKLGLKPIDSLAAQEPASYDLGGDAFDVKSPKGNVLECRPTETHLLATSPGAAIARAFFPDGDASDEDDSMALFSKKKVNSDAPAGSHMQGHVYFVAMLGILLTHGDVHSLSDVSTPLNPRPWGGSGPRGHHIDATLTSTRVGEASSHQILSSVGCDAGIMLLRANIGAPWALVLFFAVAGLQDHRNFHKNGRREKQPWRAMLRPLAVVYGVMVVLDFFKHITYEGLRRNLDWAWADKQQYPWPRRPNLTRTKWFVFILAVARLVGRRTRRLCAAKPWLEKYILLVALLVMVVVKAECPEAAFRFPGGRIYYYRVSGICVYLLAPAVLPRNLLTPGGSGFAVGPKACLEFEVYAPLLEYWRKCRGSKVVPFLPEGGAGRRGAVRLPPSVARHLCLLVLLLRQLASTSALGYDEHRSRVEVFRQWFLGASRAAGRFHFVHLWAESATPAPRYAPRTLGTNNGAAHVVVCGLRAFCAWGAAWMKPRRAPRVVP